MLLRIIVSSLLLISITTFGWCGVDLTPDADYINVGNGTSLQIVSDMTIACWVNLDDYGAYNGVLSKTDPSHTNVAAPYDYYITQTTGTQTFVRGSGNGIVIGTNFDAGNSNSAVGIGAWHHIAVVASGGSGLNIAWYLDGVADGTDTFTISNGIADEAGNAYIGSRLDVFVKMDGKMSDLAIWDTALTADEIALLAKSKVKGIPLQIQPANLQGYWPLDDFSDGTALNTTADGYKDRSGNGNHGQGVDANGNSTNIAESILSYP